MIDTHTHLYAEEFDNDRTEVIERAKAIGVTHFFLPAINSEYHEKMLELEQQYSDCMSAMIGLHPTYIKPETYQQELNLVKQYLNQRPFCAIGEIGIDLYWDKTHLELQKECFRKQIDWAIEFDRPIVIHSRDSFDETFEVLEEKRHPKLRGIFHCFTGTIDHAQHAIDLNFKLGIGGVVTFKNGKIDQFLNEIPLEHIVLETDAPYLAPVPFRGKRNESAYLDKVMGKLVDIYQKPYAEIEEITTQNAKAVFGM